MQLDIICLSETMSQILKNLNWQWIATLCLSTLVIADTKDGPSCKKLCDYKVGQQYWSVMEMKLC